VLQVVEVGRSLNVARNVHSLLYAPLPGQI